MPYIDFTKVKLSRSAAIKVKSATDRHLCNITDLAVLPGDILLLADSNNLSVKLVDPASGQLLDKLQLPGQPHGLCLLPGDRAAVTIPGMSRIQTISVTMKKLLSLQDVINVNGECNGIDYVNDYFVVGFNKPSMLALIYKKGKIYKSVTTDSINHTVFKYPYYICVTTENTSQVIYVLDLGTRTITRLSDELQVLQSFRDPALHAPRGLASVGGGQLLVVNYGGWFTPSPLSVLDVTTGQVTPLLGREENLNVTDCVAVSQTPRTVYVADNACRAIRQYRFE